MFNLYMIGNSLTDEVLYNGFDTLVESQGYTLEWARHMIPGAPLDWILNNSTSGFNTNPYGYFPQAFSNYTWDAVTLQPYDRRVHEDVRAIDEILTQLEINSPEAQVYIYAQWPNNNGQDWETQWLRPYTGGWDGTQRTKDYYETLTLTLNETDSPLKPFYMIPVGHVMYELHQRMEAGLIPNYTSITQVYADDSHLNDVGSYIVATSFFATIFQQSPIGLPIPIEYRDERNSAGESLLSEELAALIQDAVWDVVTTTPLSGVAATIPFSIKTLGLTATVEDQDYSKQLEAVGGTAPYTWEWTGDVPPGLTLTSEGLLNGIPTDPGIFEFTIRVKDALGAQVESAFTLIVETDSIPEITTDALPEAARGSAYRYQLEAIAGEGRLTWELIDGALPQGLSLQADGQLVGTPEMEGSYSFTLKVSDADETPDIDTQIFTMSVGAPTADTLLVTRSPGPVTVDGTLNLDEWVLPHAIAQPSLGSPNNTAHFGVVWDDTYLYIGVKVLDESLITDSSSGGADDSVEIFIDAEHDREVVFNNDDRQFVLSLNGTLTEQSGRLAGVEQAIQSFAGGYTVEMAIPWANLGQTARANLAIGFDIAQNDDDNGGARDHQLLWQAVNTTTPAPNQFGNLLLIDETIPIRHGFLATIYVNEAGIVIGEPYFAGLVYNAVTMSLNGTSGHDVIVGTSASEKLWGGTAGDDIIDAGEGDNNIFDDSGNNIIKAGAGNDLIGIGNGNDVVNAGNGKNFLYLASAIGTNGGNNSITTGANNDIIWLLGGNNVIQAGDGDDSIGVGSGKDSINAGNGNNIIYMTVTSSANDEDKDVVTGAGNDWVQTGSGDDRLDLGTNPGGNAGYDSALGQGGRDTFVLNEGTGFLNVGDFVQGEDQLEISGFTFRDIGFSSDAGRNLTWVWNNISGDILASLQNFTGNLTVNDFLVA